MMLPNYLGQSRSSNNDSSIAAHLALIPVTNVCFLSFDHNFPLANVGKIININRDRKEMKYSCKLHVNFMDSGAFITHVQ